MTKRLKRVLLSGLLVACLVLGLVGIVGATGPVYPTFEGTAWEARTRIPFRDLDYSKAGRDADVVYVTLNITDQDDWMIADEVGEPASGEMGPGAVLSIWFRGADLEGAANKTFDMYGMVGAEDPELRTPRPWLVLHSADDQTDLNFRTASVVALVRYDRAGDIHSIRVLRLTLALPLDGDLPYRWGWGGFNMRLIPEA